MAQQIVVSVSIDAHTLGAVDSLVRELPKWEGPTTVHPEDKIYLDFARKREQSIAFSNRSKVLRMLIEIGLKNLPKPKERAK